MNIYSIPKDSWPFKKLAINSFGTDPFSDVLKKKRGLPTGKLCAKLIFGSSI